MGGKNGSAGLKEILFYRRPAGLGLARPATGITGFPTKKRVKPGPSQK